jgi:hypothetical protein
MRFSPASMVPEVAAARHLGFLGAAVPPSGQPPNLAVEEIAAIGANYNLATGFHPYDRVWIGRTLAFLRAHDLGVSAAPRIRPWNLVNGHDILAAVPRSQAEDVWIACWLWNPRSPLDADPDPDKSYSRRHFEPGAWHDAARDAGVKIVVTFANRAGPDGRPLAGHDRRTEVDGRAFTGANYLRGPEYDFKMSRNSRELDVVMETVFRRDYATSLGKSTCCSDALRDFLGDRLRDPAA